MTAGPRALRLAAPAKLNLGLRVLGRRSDGTHELDSVFVPLDLADTVELEIRSAGAPAVDLELSAGAASGGIPGAASNLATRAARGFLEAARLRCAVRIRLEKRIPVAAGLGGGSSDAGAVLRGLSRCLPGALAPEALAELALSLGADVPFFLDPRPARVRGVGERIAPLELPSLALLLANPAIPLPTARVFEAYDLLGPGAPAAPPAGRPAAEGPGVGPLRALALGLGNDLEPAAVRLCPPIARLREGIRALGALGVGMSGSGPTVFGLFADRAGAEAALARAGFPGPVWARVATTVQSE